MASLNFFLRTCCNHVRPRHCEFKKRLYLTLASDTAPSVAETAKRHGVPNFRDLDEFLKCYKSGSLAVDALILATPTPTHISLTQLVENSGLAVLIEKPLSATGRDGKALLALSKRDTQGVYMVGHHRRHNAYVKAVKHVLDEKKLGDIMAVNGGKPYYLALGTVVVLTGRNQ